MSLTFYKISDFRVLTNNSFQQINDRLFLKTFVFGLVFIFPILVFGVLSILHEPAIYANLERTIKYFYDVNIWLYCGNFDLNYIHTQLFLIFALVEFSFGSFVVIGLPIYLLHKWRKIVLENATLSTDQKTKQFQANQKQLIISLIFQVKFFV